MVNPTNTLLKGWPGTTEILDKNNQFLGYRLHCRYPTPWGRKALKYASLPLFFGAFFLAASITSDMPQEEAGWSMLFWLAVLGGVGKVLLYRLLLGRLELEIRPQVTAWRARPGHLPRVMDWAGRTSRPLRSWACC